VSAMSLGTGRRCLAAGAAVLVTMLTSVLLALIIGFTVAAITGPSGASAAPVIFLVLWGASSLAVLILLTRSSLRRTRQDLAAGRLRERSCLLCGSGVRGVTGPENGIVRCPECGAETLRRAGPAAGDRSGTVLPAAAVDAAVLAEPRTTLLLETVAEPEDVDRLTVTLSEGSPGLATPALAVAAVVFVVGVLVGMPAWAWLIELSVGMSGRAMGASLGGPAREILDSGGAAIVVIGLFMVAMRIFRVRACRDWRQATITAIECGACFRCHTALGGTEAEDGWHVCRACGERTPGRR